MTRTTEVMLTKIIPKTCKVVVYNPANSKEATLQVIGKAQEFLNNLVEDESAKNTLNDDNEITFIAQKVKDQPITKIKSSHHYQNITQDDKILFGMVFNKTIDLVMHQDYPLDKFDGVFNGLWDKARSKRKDILGY